jgi:hypothetical protein
MATIQKIFAALRLEATETGVDVPSTPAANSAASLTHDAFNISQSLGAATTPVGTKIAFFELALSGGAASIDLTALPHNGGTVDGTGLKVQAALFRNPAANAAMTVKDGASNGYNIFGDSSGQVTIPGHATKASAVMLFFPEGLPDVAAGAKTIDVTGTGTEVLEVGLVLG